jgi:hypothetical protein
MSGTSSARSLRSNLGIAAERAREPSGMEVPVFGFAETGMTP